MIDNKCIVHCLFMLVNTLTNVNTLPYCKVLPKNFLLSTKLAYYIISERSRNTENWSNTEYWKFSFDHRNKLGYILKFK